LGVLKLDKTEIQIPIGNNCILGRRESGWGEETEKTEKPYK